MSESSQGSSNRLTPVFMGKSYFTASVLRETANWVEEILSLQKLCGPVKVRLGPRDSKSSSVTAILAVTMVTSVRS